MSYNLHITRADHWSENAGRKVTLAEWERYVSRDPELSNAPDLGEGFVAWTVPDEEPGASPPWLAYQDGNIYATYPDKDLFLKMLTIAKDLRARLQGDDGELYVHPDEYPGVDMRRADQGDSSGGLTLLERLRRERWIETVIIFLVLLGMFLWRMWN